jgi:hypothetical protein
MPAAGARLVAYADGPASARIAPAEALAAAGLTGRPEVLLGLTVERHAWLDDPNLRGTAVLPGYALARAVADGADTARWTDSDAVAARRAAPTSA